MRSILYHLYFRILDQRLVDLVYDLMFTGLRRLTMLYMMLALLDKQFTIAMLEWKYPNAKSRGRLI